MADIVEDGVAFPYREPAPVSKNVTVQDYGPIEEHDPDLIEAMRLHNLDWEGD